MRMIDLNSASVTDITAAGLDPDIAREVGFWRPYRSWDQLFLVGGFDETALERLQSQGFEIKPPNDAALMPPKPFKLSAAAQQA